jgi:hypothetical protein
LVTHLNCFIKPISVKIAMLSLSVQIPCEFDSNYSVLIEDDGRVAYAYLMEYGDVISDVWLYNHTQAIKVVDWNNQQMPYLNPI